MRADVRSWLALGAVLALANQLLGEYLWILGLLPIAAWGLAGLILLAVHVFRQPSQTEQYWRRWNVLGLIAGFVLFAPVASFGSVLVRHGRFRWHRSEYQRIVVAVEAGQPVQSGLPYEVDAGPPKRIAFAWPGGIIDNWCGVVYDRTGGVLQVNSLAPWSPQWRSHSMTRLFGGDMTSCRQLDTQYYLCCFT
jgi:hypothetical protein